MPVSSDAYKQLGRAAAGPVSIVAAYDRTTDKVVGLTVSSFVTLSFESPLVMLRSSTCRQLLIDRSSKGFGVSLLQHTPAEIATLFATKGADKTSTTRLDKGTTLQVR